jgi:hypothetical protein
MTRIFACTWAALALLAAASAHASAPGRLADDSLPALFVRYFYDWKSQPPALKVSQLKVLDAGDRFRVLCGMYDVPGQDLRPFLVLGDDKPSASAAWEPGSFPENDPLYGQLMANLRACQSAGAPVTAQGWQAGGGPNA